MWLSLHIGLLLITTLSHQPLFKPIPESPGTVPLFWACLSLEHSRFIFRLFSFSALYLSLIIGSINCLIRWPLWAVSVWSFMVSLVLWSTWWLFPKVLMSICCHRRHPHSSHSFEDDFWFDGTRRSICAFNPACAVFVTLLCRCLWPQAPLTCPTHSPPYDPASFSSCSPLIGSLLKKKKGIDW